MSGMVRSSTRLPAGVMQGQCLCDIINMHVAL